MKHAWAALAAAACSDAPDPESNRPVVSSEGLADPHVIRHDGHDSVVQDEDGKRWIYFHQNARRFNLGMGSRYTSRGELLIDRDGKLSVRL